MDQNYSHKARIRLFSDDIDEGQVGVRRRDISERQGSGLLGSSGIHRRGDESSHDQDVRCVSTEDQSTRPMMFNNQERINSDLHSRESESTRLFNEPAFYSGDGGAAARYVTSGNDDEASRGVTEETNGRGDEEGVRSVSSPQKFMRITKSPTQARTDTFPFMTARASDQSSEAQGYQVARDVQSQDGVSRNAEQFTLNSTRPPRRDLCLDGLEVEDDIGRSKFAAEHGESQNGFHENYDDEGRMENIEEVGSVAVTRGGVQQQINNLRLDNGRSDKTNNHRLDNGRLDRDPNYATRRPDTLGAIFLAQPSTATTTSHPPASSRSTRSVASSGQAGRSSSPSVTEAGGGATACAAPTHAAPEDRIFDRLNLQQRTRAAGMDQVCHGFAL